jgi:antitoxin component YwqK of YwqJK toxin-antitoxin module
MKNDTDAVKLLDNFEEHIEALSCIEDKDLRTKMLNDLIETFEHLITEKNMNSIESNKLIHKRKLQLAILVVKDTLSDLSQKGKALDAIVKNILTLLLAEEEVKNMGRNFIDDMPECFYTEELTLLYIDSLIGDIFEYPSRFLLLLPSRWSRELFLQANNLMITESFQKQRQEYLEKLTMFQHIVFKDKNYIARNDKVRLVTAYNLINRLVIEHFSEGQDYNFSDIGNLSLDEAIERFCFSDADEQKQNHFIYFLMKFKKFDIDNHSFPICKKVFTARFNHFMELKKSLDFSNRLKRPRTTTHITLDDIDLMTGQQFEHFIAELFLKLGYTTEVTQASGDQGIDVIASKDGKKTGIQTKCYSSSVGNTAIQEAVAGRVHYKLDRAMVITNNYFTDAAKKLAGSNAVILWDRSVLKEKIINIDDNKTNYIDGKQDVLKICWYENGQKKTANYIDGKINGLETCWYENGQKKTETNYIDGKINGLETCWYENGQKKTETNYIDGKENGLATYWSESGQKESETNYIDGERNGLCTQWLDNGKMETNYIDGKKNGLEPYWNESGQKIRENNYIDGKLNSETYWNELGLKTETHYSEGMKNGLETSWTKNGQKIFEKNWVNNEANGIEVQWNRNGFKLYEKYYFNGMLNGLQTYWHENSKYKKSQTSYINGVVHGLEIEWYTNGKKSCETNYINGNILGYWLWDENGRKSSYCTFG